MPRRARDRARLDQGADPRGVSQSASASAASCRASAPRRRCSPARRLPGSRGARAWCSRALLPAPERGAATRRPRAPAPAPRAAVLATDCERIGAHRWPALARARRSRRCPRRSLAPQVARAAAARAGRTRPDHARRARPALRDRRAARGISRRSAAATCATARRSSSTTRAARCSRMSARPARHSAAAAVDGVRALPPGGLDAEAVPVRARLRATIPDAGVAARRLADQPRTATGSTFRRTTTAHFLGAVSARTALGSSLNMPAVRTLVLVGVEDFRERLGRSATTASPRTASTTATRSRSARPKSGSGSRRTRIARSRTAGAARRSRCVPARARMRTPHAC